MSRQREHASLGGAVSVLAMALVMALATGCGSSGGSTTIISPTAASLAPVHGKYSPSIDPANFVSTVDNRYLPYKPGMAWHYKGVAENGTTPLREEEVVLHQTKRVLGVDCTAVRDVITSSAGPVQRTFDWYAQDKQGNVWYFGENTADFKHGRFVQAIDSGPAGVSGAQPGIVMPARPQTGEAYRQYNWPAHAVDDARVVGSRGTFTTPYRTFKRPLVTIESSPLEPGVREKKYNVPGVGVIGESVLRGNHEHFELVGFTG